LDADDGAEGHASSPAYSFNEFILTEDGLRLSITGAALGGHPKAAIDGHLKGGHL